MLKGDTVEQARELCCRKFLQVEGKCCCSGMRDRSDRIKQKREDSWMKDAVVSNNSSSIAPKISHTYLLLWYIT